MFGTILVIHIILGGIGLLTGPVVILARKVVGTHTKLGEFYHWIMFAICGTAATLALLDWQRFWIFLWIALGSYAFAFVGYVSAKVRWHNWLKWHVIGQASSYVAIVTAVFVTNWRVVIGWTGLSEAWAWILPTVIGAPLIAWITREVVLGRRPRF